MTLILGIDPGSRITGYGLVEEDARRQLRYVDSGCIRTTEAPLSQRLLEIFNGICIILEQFHRKKRRLRTCLCTKIRIRHSN